MDLVMYLKITKGAPLWESWSNSVVAGSWRQSWQLSKVNHWLLGFQPHGSARFYQEERRAERRDRRRMQLADREGRGIPSADRVADGHPGMPWETWESPGVRPVW